MEGDKSWEVLRLNQVNFQKTAWHCHVKTKQIPKSSGKATEVFSNRSGEVESMRQFLQEVCEVNHLRLGLDRHVWARSSEVGIKTQGRHPEQLTSASSRQCHFHFERPESFSLFVILIIINYKII